MPHSNLVVGGLSWRVAIAYLVITAAVVSVYGAAWPAAPVLDGDSPQYLAVARDLADGRLDELHDRSPGYPALVALTGSAEVPTRTLFYASLLLHAASIWLLGLVLCAAGVGPWRLIAFGALLALPLYAEPAGYVMTENLAQFTLAAGVAGVALWFASRRSGWLAVAALAFGYAALTRPVYQLVAVAIAGAAVVLARVARDIDLPARDAFVAAAAVAAGSILLAGGFATLNYAKFGYGGISPSAGFHLTTKTSALFERLPDEYAAVRDVLIRHRDALLTEPGGRHNGTQAIWRAKTELLAVTGLGTPELSAYLVRMNVALIRRAPIEYLEEVARALSHYWFPAAGPLATGHSSLLRWLWALLHAAVVGTFFVQVAAVTGLIAIRQRIAAGPVVAAAWLIAGAVVAYTMVLSVFLDIGEPRQRRATDVLIVLMCFLAAHVWRQARAEPRG